MQKKQLVGKALVVASFLAAPALAEQLENPATALEAPTVEVIGTTPLPGLGTPRDQIPSNVQSATGAEMAKQQAINLPDFVSQSLPSVNVNDTQGNPFQPEVNYRGFTASPLLGVPQGLSVYQDGVRINEPFGDVVNWDLIPQSAISTINVIPGSNPLFGLNTLGGALSVRTKSGGRYPDTSAQAYGGSFERRAAEFEHGGYNGNFDYFITGNWFKEDGWRDFSPSDVKQVFSKVGWERADTDFDFSITHANTDLTGNELVPLSMFNQRREQVFTLPDRTQNNMTLLNLTGSHWFTDSLLVSGNVYYRRSRRNGSNGDTNDAFEGGPNDGATGANGGLGFNDETAVTNRLRIVQRGHGSTLQASHQRESNQLTVGTTYDRSRSVFDQFEQEGIFNEIRGVNPTANEEPGNSFVGRIRTVSFFITDIFAVTPRTHLTVSGRYNHTRVENRDQLNPVPPNLDGDFTFKKFNPAVGFTHAFMPSLTAYAGYSQGNRAPTPIELGCADPANPCTLPNALASDPFLQQVVARTYEAGLRGRLGQEMNWNLGAFRTDNRDDIIFVSTSAAAGFFTNFGKTLRQGVEAGLSGRLGRFQWNANYSFVNATFESSACLLSENNSSRGTSSCPSDDEILVSPGNRIPGIPKHYLKLTGDYAITDAWSVGASLNVFSDQFVRGNENSQHQAGTFTDNFGNTRTFLNSGEAAGYSIVNFRARYRFAPRWEVFARVDNLFDKNYFTGGALAENPFNAAGVFQTNSDDWTRETFFAPGAPRAGWVGIKYVFGRSPRK